jgi:hypothetical protein
MQDKPARLAVGGPHAFANVIIGQAHFGKFRLILWDETGRNPQVLTEQTNVDNIPDFVDLGTPRAVTRKILQWEGFISAFGSGSGQLYSVIIEVMQGGQVVPDGLIMERGILEGGAKPFFGAVRLLAV